MFKKSVTFTAIFIGIFAGLFVANSAFINSTYAYELTVTTSGDTIIKPENGQVVTKTSKITVKTDCRAGYTLQIQGPTDTNLYLDGDATKNETDKYIKPVNATSALNTQPNTYGYNLTSNQTNQTFNPLTSTATTLKTIAETQSPTADINETINIYWGAYAGLNLSAGTYKMPNNGAATYIITTSPTCVSYTVNFNNNGGSGTMNPQEIPVGTPTNLTPNTFTSPETWQNFIAWTTNSDGTGAKYTNEQSVTDLAAAEQSITLYAQWGCGVNKICYTDNGANSPTTMGNQTITTTATEANLWPSNFQRANHGFAGWNTKADGTGTNYGPNETITDTNVIANIKSEGLILYAKWVAPTGNLQNWMGCGFLKIGDVTALTDLRDNNVYAVARLADGNCWMIENLRLNNTADHNTDGSLAQGYNSSFIGLADVETPWTTNSLNANSLYSRDGTTAVTISGSNPAYRFPRYNNYNTTSPTDSMDAWNNNANIYSLGNYYTWTAAIADINDYYTNNQNITETSLCPSSWRLPKGGDIQNTTSEFMKYGETITGAKPTNNSSYTGTPEGTNASSKLRAYPNNFIYSGFVSNAQLRERGASGFFWSSTGSDGPNSYFLYINRQAVTPGSVKDYKTHGRSVRCITQSASTYAVKFDANGGTGEMPDQYIRRNYGTQLTESAFTAPETWQTFINWNTKSDGSGTTYTNKQTIYNLVAENQTITLYAQYGCPPRKICYLDNGANSPTKMSIQNATGTTAILWPSNFQRPGYGFTGWSKKPDGSDTMYGPNETIAPGNLNFRGIELYAIWKETKGTLQNWKGCSSLASGETTALTDNRDNNTYAVAKLADGNCWMIENLRLDQNATLTSENTNNPAISKLVLVDDAATECAGIADLDCPKIKTFNITETVDQMGATNANIYSYGNYYRWLAATAGYGTIGFIGEVPGDICPFGWRLPTIYGDSTTPGYKVLDKATGGTGEDRYDSNGKQSTSENLRKYPTNFVPAGAAPYSSVNYRGVRFDYVSSVSNNTTTFGNFFGDNFNTRFVWHEKGNFNSVRCVTKSN